MTTEERRASPERKPPVDPTDVPEGRYSSVPVKGIKKKNPFNSIILPEEK